MSNAAYDFQIVCPTLQGLVPGQDIHVTYWKGTEAVSQLYQFEIKFAVRQANLALEKLLNEPATFIAHKPDGSVLCWHGIVTGGSQQGRDETFDYYQVILEPRLAKLRTQFWSDIYLDKQLDDIIRQLLRSIGLDEPYSVPGAPYDYHIAASKMVNTKRPFVCQFEETCLAFLMRKLEFYGVYFWFEQGKDHESIVFANSVDQQPSDPDIAVYYPKGVIDPDAQEVVITQLNRSVNMLPGSVTLHDSTTWQNTVMSLDSSATAPGPIPAFGDEHRYRNHYETVTDEDAAGNPVVGGETLATWRSQEMACERERIWGEAQTPGVRAGRMLEVSEYLRGASPNQYYVIEVTHKGQQPLETAPDAEGSAYFSQFVALPRWLDASDENPQPLQFRPARSTPVPVISQMVNGFVDIVDPKKPQLYAQMDAEGRYMVRLPFAKKRYPGDQNSAHLRMATPYAAGTSTSDMKLQNAGMHFPLREGTEVIIAFLNGDPDRPVIMAALPNTEAPSVVTSANPGDHIVRTPSGNLFAMLDNAPNPKNYELDEKSSILLNTTSPSAMLSLGQCGSANPGFYLTTEENGTVYAGQSMKMEVPGHWRMSAGTAPDANSTTSNFISSQATGLDQGINVSQTGGIVVSNFLGMKIEAVESVSLSQFFGAKINLAEAAEFSMTLGLKYNVSSVKTWNVDPVQWVSTALKRAFTAAEVVNVAESVESTYVDKTENVGDYSITAVGSFDLETVGPCQIDATAALAVSSGATIDMDAPAIELAAEATLDLTAPDVSIAGEAIELDSTATIALTAPTIEITAEATLDLDGAEIYMNSALISLA
ncbi:type VI secretion system Vgr family protein [Bordetella tumulicola]|uniref:type VI secretion system Vgr family protein n=1 Tax=Bordetella tumulicola TaxID=1649133 RepID=UPI0039F0D007